MCDPVSLGIATAALGVGQSVSAFIGGRQAYAVNKEVANLNYANQRDIIDQKRVQLDQNKSENAVDTAIASVKAQGEVAASAASMGLSSSSIAQALNSDMFGIGRQVEAESVNDQNQRLQLANEQRGAAVEREAQIASKSRPGALDLALSIGSDALKGASAYSTAGGKF